MCVDTCDDEDDEFHKGNEQSQDCNADEQGRDADGSTVPVTIASPATIPATPSRADIAVAVDVCATDVKGQQCADDDGRHPQAKTDADVGSRMDPGLPLTQAADDNLGQGPDEGQDELDSDAVSILVSLTAYHCYLLR